MPRALLAVLAGLALAACGMYGDLYREEPRLPEITEEPPIAAEPATDPAAEPAPAGESDEDRRDQDDGAGPR